MNGLDATTARELVRDLIAGMQMQAIVEKTLVVRHEEETLVFTTPDKLNFAAYQLADELLTARDETADRRKRLADMGALLVDLAVQDVIDIPCPFCDGKISGPHDDERVSECPLGAFLRIYMSTPTMPSPAPEAPPIPSGTMTGPDRGSEG